MPRDDKCDHLITDLDFSKRVTLVISCSDEQVQHVFGHLTHAAQIEHRANGAIQSRHRAAEFPITRRGHPGRWRNRHSGAGDDDIESVEGCSGQRIGICREIGAEERTTDNFEGRVHDRRIYVDHCAVGKCVPVVNDALGGRGYVCHDRGEGLAVEGRLHHGALALPFRSVSGKQPLPRHERQRGVLNRRLAVVARIGDEHAAHAVRIIDEITGRLRDRKLHDVAVGAPDGVKVGKRVLADSTEGAEHRLTGGARGRAGSRHIATIGDRAHYGASAARAVRSAGTP